MENFNISNWNDFLIAYHRFKKNEIEAKNASNEMSKNQENIWLGHEQNIFIEFWLNGFGMFLIIIIGIFGNITSIKILLRKEMRSPVNYILVALALADLIMIITMMLLNSLIAIYPYTGFLKDYYFIAFPVISIIAYPIGTIAHTASIYLTLLISIERYIAVCHPLKAKAFCTKNQAKSTVLVLFLMSSIYNIPRFFEYTLIEMADDSGIYYSLQFTYLRKNDIFIEIYIHWLYFFIIFLIPLTGIISLNLMIYRKVNALNRLRIKLTSMQIQEINLTPMLFCVVIVFFFCLLPSVIVNILEAFFVEFLKQNAWLVPLSNFLVAVNSSVNFIIYVVLVEKFRLIFIKKFKKVVSCRLTNSNEATLFSVFQTDTTAV